MSTKEVTAKKFDALMAKNITLGKCPKCREWGGELKIPITAFGSESRTAYVRCKYCFAKTRKYSISTTIYDTENERIGCPVIEKSLMGAIRQAVNDWNGKGNGKQTHISGNEAL